MGQQVTKCEYPVLESHEAGRPGTELSDPVT